MRRYWWVKSLPGKSSALTFILKVVVKKLMATHPVENV